MTENTPSEQPAIEEENTTQKEVAKEEKATEEKEISNSKAKGGFNGLPLGLYIGLGILTIVYSIYYIYRLSMRPKHTIIEYHNDNSLTYVFNSDFERQLNLFLKPESIRSAFVVYGPRGIGKTTGFAAYSKNLNKNGRLSLHLDFDVFGKDITPEELVYFLSKQISSSISSLNLKPPVLNNLKSVIPAIETFVSLNKRKFARNPASLQYIGQLLSEIISNTDDIAFLTFFDALEAMGPIVRPVVFISGLDDIDRFNNHKTKTALSILLKSCWTKAELVRKSAIILEFDQYLEHLEGHKIYRLGEFSEAEGRASLVEQDKIFTSSQYQSLYATFGGYGGFYRQAYELLRDEVPFDKIVKKIKRSIEILTKLNEPALMFKDEKGKLEFVNQFVKEVATKPVSSKRK